MLILIFFLLFLINILNGLISVEQSRGLVVGRLCFFGSELHSIGLFGNSSVSLNFDDKGSAKKTIISGAINIQVLDYNSVF